MVIHVFILRMRILTVVKLTAKVLKTDKILMRVTNKDKDYEWYRKSHIIVYL